MYIFIMYIQVHICGVRPLVGWLNPHMLHRNSPGWSLLWFQRPIGLGLQLQGRRPPPSYKLTFNIINYSYTKLYLPILVVGDIYTNLAITWGPYLVPLKSMCPRSFPRRQGAVCTKEMPDSPWAVHHHWNIGCLISWKTSFNIENNSVNLTIELYSEWFNIPMIYGYIYIYNGWGFLK